MSYILVVGRFDLERETTSPETPSGAWRRIGLPIVTENGDNQIVNVDPNKPTASLPVEAVTAVVIQDYLIGIIRQDVKSDQIAQQLLPGAASRQTSNPVVNIGQLLLRVFGAYRGDKQALLVVLHPGGTVSRAPLDRVELIAIFGRAIASAWE